MKNLFPKTKKELNGCHFKSDDDVIAVVDHILEVKDADFYMIGSK